jgi:general secretion pathway protein M
MIILNRNQLLLVFSGLVLLVSATYYFLLLGPVLEKRHRLERAVEKREGDLMVMTGLHEKWAEIGERQAAADRILGRREAGFNLLSFLEGVSREAGVSENVVHMKPISFSDTLNDLRQEGMEISLEGVALQEITRYLYGIEYAEGLMHVRRIRIQRPSEEKFPIALKVTLQVIAYLPAASVKKP